ncbi:MAG: glycosyltransferase [Chloroflexi bacterium]|nr:glycosyltransferase [Chloroflexota bacterium]
MRFSIVTPSYNQGRYIERTIESVLAQGCDVEYVVIDGGSTDGTLDMLRRYEGRLRWTSEPDEGQTDAVNKGIRMTSGDVIGWVNSDDVYYPGAVATVRSFLETNPSVDLVYGDGDWINAEDKVIGHYYTEPWSRDGLRDVPERLKQRCFLCQPAVFFRRRVVDRYGLFDPTLHYTMDYEYWLRLAAGRAQFAYLPVALAGARLHAETKTSASALKLYTELHPMLRRYMSRTPDGWLLSHTHALLDAEWSSERFRSPWQFAVAVALLSLQLSVHVNGSISPHLLGTTARTLLAGAVKTALGTPIEDVLQKRMGT